MSPVKLLARWDGWCDPCQTERPLLLTEAGPRGLRAWLDGVGPQDRRLTLTCAVCGQWQLVSWDEEDVVQPAPTTPAPAVAPTAPAKPVRAAAPPTRASSGPVDVRPVVIRLAPGAACPAAGIPRPRTPQSQPVPQDDVFDLLAQGLDLISTAAR